MVSKKKQVTPAQALLKRYRDPSKPGSLGGVERFAKTWKISNKRAQNLLRKDLAYTLHRPRRRKGFPTLPIKVMSRDEQWQADLIETQNIAKENKGIRYLLTVIDILSKYAWVQPLKDKKGPTVVKAFDQILKEGRQPLKLQTDKGKEFYNKDMSAWLKKNNIHHFSTGGDAKAAVVERFNRTLKERLYRYFTAANTLTFTDVLPELVYGYNASIHSSIKMAPQEVTLQNEKQVWNTLYGKPPKIRKPTLKKGDKVRLNKIHRPFAKGYLPGWTEEVFLVEKVKPFPAYKITEWDGTPVDGTFYEEDLQKVTTDDVFRVEKVLKRRKNQLFVKWKGWPDKYNSWINTEDVRDPTQS